MSEGLKLRAIEPEDITILSAAVEGAITSPGEISYSQTSRTFTLTSSRFMWEKHKSAKPVAQRIRSGLFFADILSVKTSGIAQTPRTAVMELLSISCETGKDGTAEIKLNFANDPTLLLNAECINVTLTDVGDSWTVERVPSPEGAK